MKKIFSFVLLGMFLVLPLAASAAFIDVIVPACRSSACPCTLCDLYELAGRVINFLLFNISLPLAALMILWGGFKMLVSQGNPNAISEGRKILANTVIGMALAFFGWAIINSLLVTLTGGTWTNWYKVPACTSGRACRMAIKTRETITPWGPVGTLDIDRPGFADGYDITSPGADALIRAPGEGSSWDQESKGVVAADVSAYSGAISSAASKYGIDEARLKAIIAAESSGNPLATHLDLDGKSSYGLMQVRPDTARGLDPSLASLSDAQIAARLQDPAYNIELGAKHYSQLLAKYGNPTLASAAFNGGPVANRGSINCPGVKRWQCEWDNNAHTVPNTGYSPTRRYISNIDNLERAYRQ